MNKPMKQLCMVALLALASSSLVQPANPDQALYDSAVRNEALGRYKAARTKLVKIGQANVAGPLAMRARNELDALDLFLEAREQQRAGRRTATVTYHTVAQVYPESPLAKQAEANRRALASQPDRRAIVRSILYRGFPDGLNEIIPGWFAEHEVAFGVETPYDADRVERARTALMLLLNTRGFTGYDIQSETDAIPPHAVGITFTATRK